jgi:hypothetical protein
VDQFNAILSNEMKSQGIKYVFAIGSTQKGTTKKNNKNKEERNTEHSI